MRPPKLDPVGGMFCCCENAVGEGPGRKEAPADAGRFRPEGCRAAMTVWRCGARHSASFRASSSASTSKRRMAARTSSWL